MASPVLSLMGRNPTTTLYNQLIAVCAYLSQQDKRYARVLVRTYRRRLAEGDMPAARRTVLELAQYVGWDA